MFHTENSPFQAAVDRIASKTPLASNLNSYDWGELVPLAIKERSQFSSKVNSLAAMQSVENKLLSALDIAKQDPEKAFMDRTKFVKEMREVMDSHGLNTGSTALSNPAARRRLEMIYDFQMEDAYSYGRWKMGQDPVLLNEWPCQELIRVESRNRPRGDWQARFVAAGGVIRSGRMVARKDDPVWTNISRFGRPFPPFDYGSGMGLRDVDRSEAIRLGVIEDDTEIQPTAQDFNDKVEASIRDLSAEKQNYLKEAFGDQITIQNGRASLQSSSSVISQFMQGAIKKSSVSLPAAAAQAEVNVPITVSIFRDDLAGIAARNNYSDQQMWLIGGVLSNPDRIMPAVGGRSIYIKGQIKATVENGQLIDVVMPGGDA